MDSDAKAASNSCHDARPKSRYQSLKLLLPAEVKYVVSYMTWLEEMAEHVEMSALSKTDSLGDYIRILLKDEKESQINEDGKVTCGEVGDANEDEDSDWYDNVGYVAMKMNVAAMYTYLGDYASAERHINTLDGQYLEKLKLTHKHKQVINYCRDSLSWSIGVLKGLEDKEIENIYLIKGSSKLNCKWEELSEDGDDQIKATLGFLKACLSAAMKVPEDVTLKFIVEATVLDPECHIWYHYAYRIMRRLRRNVKRSATSRLFRPSEEEERLAKKAYEICSDDVVAITDYALVLKESLWTSSFEEWQKEEAKYLECVDLFEKALKLADETGNKKWSRKITIYLAEFLVFGKGDKLNQDVGKQMFHECALEYPTSTMVLHKVGKLYHHGVGKFGQKETKKFIDLNLAKDYYQRAMDSNAGNFACLMDYLKLLQRLQDYLGMMIQIKKSLNRMKRDYQVSKLHILKGYITWIYNPEELPDSRATSLESWMFVMKNLPGFSKEVYCTRDVLYFDRNRPAHEVRAEIIQYLEAVKAESNVEEDTKMLDKFIEGLKNSIDRDRRPKIDWKKVRNVQRNDNDVDLTERMRGLNVFSRNNYSDHVTKKDEAPEWKKKNENQRRHMPGTRGTENKKPGHSDDGLSEADKDQSWRKSN